MACGGGCNKRVMQNLERYFSPSFVFPLLQKTLFFLGFFFVFAEVCINDFAFFFFVCAKMCHCVFVFFY